MVYNAPLPPIGYGSVKSPKYERVKKSLMNPYYFLPPNVRLMLDSFNRSLNILDAIKIVFEKIVFSFLFSLKRELFLTHIQCKYEDKLYFLPYLHSSYILRSSHTTYIRWYLGNMWAYVE